MAKAEIVLSCDECSTLCFGARYGTITKQQAVEQAIKEGVMFKHGSQDLCIRCHNQRTKDED